MGASQFMNLTAPGAHESVRAAFEAELEETRAEFGSDPYSGTLAAKGSFTFVETPPELAAVPVHRLVTLIDEFPAAGLPATEVEGRLLRAGITGIEDRLALVRVGTFLAKCARIYDERWGQALALAEDHPEGKRYVFCGWAPS